VKLGLVGNLNRPGGNVTGVSILSSMLLPKQLELLCELVPSATTISFLVNPNKPATEERAKEMQEAVRAVGRRLQVVTASAEAELGPAFATVERQASALIVPADPFFTSHRDRLVSVAAHHALPASYPFREYAVAGDLRLSCLASTSPARRPISSGTQSPRKSNRRRLWPNWREAIDGAEPNEKLKPNLKHPTDDASQHVPRRHARSQSAGNEKAGRSVPLSACSIRA
jgi:hypothetical protein